MTSRVALDEIVNSVPLVLVTVILLPPVIVISSFVFPDLVTPSNLIAVVPLGTNKS